VKWGEMQRDFSIRLHTVIVCGRFGVFAKQLPVPSDERVEKR